MYMLIKIFINQNNIDQTRAQAPEAGTRHGELFIQDSACESRPVIEAGGPCVTGPLPPTRIKKNWADQGLSFPTGWFLPHV